MSDEPTRSAQGNPPHHRRPGAAPAWWGDLARADLPDDTGRAPRARAVPRPAADGDRRRPAAQVATRSWLESAPPARRSTSSIGDRLRTVLAILAIAGALLVIAWLGLGGGSARSMVVAVIVIGVPAAAAASIVGLLARRAH